MGCSEAALRHRLVRVATRLLGEPECGLQCLVSRLLTVVKGGFGSSLGIDRIGQKTANSRL